MVGFGGVCGGEESVVFSFLTLELFENTCGSNTLDRHGEARSAVAIQQDNFTGSPRASGARDDGVSF